jgi:hypothetical protein
MARWAEVEAAAPEFAAEVRRRFDAHIHKTLATLRRDGSPRISGIEASFIDGDLWFGMMPGSMKALDVARDPRVAIHSATVDPPANPSEWEGESKLAGRAIAETDPERAREVLAAMNAARQGEEEPPEGTQGTEADEAASEGADAAPPPLFRLDVTEAVLTHLNEAGDRLVVESWNEARGYRRSERD